MYTDDYLEYTLSFFICAAITIGLFYVIFQLLKMAAETSAARIQMLKEETEALVSGAEKVTPEEFMRRRTAKLHSGKYQPYYSSSHNFAGVYILHNESKDKYYIGQSKTVLSRVNNHFTGKGNGDVYVDYSNGDKFTIQLIPLDGSNFADLDSLERHFISYYDAYNHGYNKTKGNGTGSYIAAQRATPHIAQTTKKEYPPLLCERCHVKLEYLSDNILMMAKGAGLLNPGGGPLKFHLYRCPECRELKFFDTTPCINKEESKMGMCYRCGCQVPGDLPGLCPHCGYLANTDVPPELRKPGAKLTDIRPAEKETGPEQSIPLPEQNAVPPEQKETAPEEPVSTLAWVIVGIVFVACLVSALIIGLY